MSVIELNEAANIQSISTKVIEMEEKRVWTTNRRYDSNDDTKIKWRKNVA